MSAINRSADALPSNVTSVAPPITRAALGREVFAGVVKECLEGPVLRYSLRVDLLKQAARLGVGRFEANLVIAEAQHAARMHVYAPSVRKTARPSSFRWVVTAIMTQIVLVGAMWFAYTRL